MTSFGDTSVPVDVYTKWEREDAHGTKLDNAARKAVFGEWCSRMLQKHMTWTEEKSNTWVAEVITHNDVTSCHEFEAGWHKDNTVGRAEWKALRSGAPANLKVTDFGPMNLLYKMTELEIKAIGTTSARPSGAGTLEAAMGNQQLLMTMALSGGRAGLRGGALTNFPG